MPSRYDRLKVSVSRFDRARVAAACFLMLMAKKGDAIGLDRLLKAETAIV